MRVSPPGARVSAAAVTLRLAQATDRQRVWWWRNDPETRRASFDSAEIPWDSHRRWFDDSLKRDDRKIYIVVVHGLPEGVARLDIVGSEATVSIHLAPESRGKGIGAIALQKLAALRELKVHKLVAAVKEDNVASLFAFKKARFTETKRVDGVVTLQRLCRR